MNTNTLTFKNKLDFHQYQMLMRFLTHMGIEVTESQGYDFYYELSLEELEELRRSDQEIESGETISSEDLFKELRGEYATNKMD
ncbi:toxin-antitoxin system, antitoxin component [Capnocytophaga gingivalis]|jgi:hypothetical protein|uniref:Toxin-antitoxin system, antitoxin component n=1 Tax=Capnocytophaga gingivalis TaxID=1017 RepID=A0ABU5Z9E3_9FLAO|nr:toxin-antitoxin system, antitoxin component [Capnocytophaga gingivalis]MEB3075580.1 toxin-antitoxin system, antitoxin component [Capnocytophaga gingivalis]